MKIVLGIYLYILTWVLFNGLFNKKFYEETQNIIDSIQCSKTFWWLIKDKEIHPNNFSASKVFWLYHTKRLKGEITVGHVVNSDSHGYDFHIPKDVIKKNENAHRNISSLSQRMEQCEKEILTEISDFKLSGMREKIVEAIHKDKEQSLFIPHKGYDQLAEWFVNKFEKDESGSQIWKQREDLAKASESLIQQYQKGEDQFYILSAHFRISNLYRNLICKNIAPRDKAEKLDKLLQEWDQLYMLRDCIVDHTAWTNNTTIFDRIFWHLIVLMFFYKN